MDGYNFTTNPFDFVLLSLLRVTIIIVEVLLLISGRKDSTKKHMSTIVCLCIVNYSYTMVKFLTLTEDPKRLWNLGIWCSSVGSLAVGTFLWPIVYRFLHTREKAYSPLIEDAPGDEGTTESSTTETPVLTRRDARVMALRVLSYTLSQWMWFTFGFFFLIIYAAARIFIPAYTGQVVSDVAQKKGVAPVVHSLIIMAALSLVSCVSGGLRGGIFSYSAALVNREVRHDLFTSLMRQDIAFFDITKSGEVVSRLSADCQSMTTAVSTNINVFMRNIVMLLGAFVYMIIVSWRLAMVTFLVIPLLTYITQWYGMFFDKISEMTQTSVANANQMAEEVLSTMRTVRSFACEARETKRFKNHLDATIKCNQKNAIAYMAYTWNNELASGILLVAVLSYGAHLVLKGQLETAHLVTFLLYQVQIIENVYALGWVFTGMMESVGASRKVFELMSRIPAIAQDGSQQPSVRGQIELRDVQFAYPSRPQSAVLQGLNLTIGAGQTVALVGPSGGGKSSIVSLIEHFYEPDAGEVLLDGVPIKNIDHVYYHQKVALVAQEPVLYSGSIRDNILYGCEWATENDMLEAARTANVHNFVSELEKGYDTNCGEKGVQMSGGQKQRIAIARALVRRPAVLILDEATSALDSESEALVQEALSRCARERTVLVIAHRLSTIEKADMIAVIQKGCVMQTGTHHSLMENEDGLYYSLVSRQILGTTQQE